MYINYNFTRKWTCSKVHLWLWTGYEHLCNRTMTVFAYAQTAFTCLKSEKGHWSKVWHQSKGSNKDIWRGLLTSFLYLGWWYRACLTHASSVSIIGFRHVIGSRLIKWIGYESLWKDAAKTSRSKFSSLIDSLLLLML